MTMADNVDYPLLIAGLPPAERRARVAEVLRAVGLQDHACTGQMPRRAASASGWRSPARWSNGQRW